MLLDVARLLELHIASNLDKGKSTVTARRTLEGVVSRILLDAGHWIEDALRRIRRRALRPDSE
jgi:hypothetical protein